MATDELEVRREDDVALEDAGTHAQACELRFARFLWDEQRAATAVADGEAGALHGLLGAGLEGVFKRGGIHIVDEEVGARAKLDLGDKGLWSVGDRVCEEGGSEGHGQGQEAGDGLFGDGHCWGG